MKHVARLLIAGLLAIPVIAVSASAPVLAEKTCWLDDESGTMRCKITTAPSAPPTTTTFDSIPIGWRRNMAFAGPAVGFCVRNEDVDGVPTQIIGVPWIVELFDVASGNVLSTSQVCEFPGDEPPQPPPPPPTPEEYIEAIEELLVVGFELSPPAEFEGITGVDTWFWCNTPDTASIAPITLDGWTVEAEMNAILFSWSVSGPGDGGSSDSETCGTAPALDGDGDGAAWKWQPQTLGEYTIEFTSTWLGTWTQTYDGTNVGTFPLGPAPIDQEPVIYPVGEYVGVLTGE